jgi:hypothetical protein
MDNLEFLIPISMFAMVGWIVYVGVTNGRRQKQLKVTTDFHAKILDKMGSAKDLGEFMETDGGKRFLSSLTVEGPSAKTRIVRGAENAVIFLSVGIAFLLLAKWLPDEHHGLAIIGTLITACGTGFAISCVVSGVMSKAFGLFDSPDGRR